MDLGPIKMKSREEIFFFLLFLDKKEEQENPNKSRNKGKQEYQAKSVI